MKRIRYLTMLMLLLPSISTWGQFDFDPSDPPEPGLPPMRLELRVSPNEAGSVSGGGTYAEGTSVPLRAYTNTGFRFDRWTNADGETISYSANFAYTKGEGHEVLTANYVFDPDAPVEPADPATILYYRLTLTQNEGGSVSGGGRYLAGTKVYLRAYTNTGFDFDGWYDKDGECVSTSSYFEYTMPEGATTLEGRFTFNPDSPREPDEPIVKHSVMATAGEGGYTNFSLIRQLTGTGVTLTAYCNTGYRFDGWYLNGELYTKQPTFSYTIGEENVSFEARFYFDPDSPKEPGMPQTGKYAFTLMNKVTKPGATIKYPIYLTSLDELHDMTFQLTFPEGLLPSLALEDIEVSDKSEDYMLSVSPGDGPNAYVISLIGGSIPDVSTALLTFTIVVPEGIATAQNYQVIINQVSVTEANDNTLTASTRNGRISVYKNGDTNGDDAVNVVDVANTISCILGETPDDYIAVAGDTNDDNDINVVDVAGTIDIILDEGSGTSVAPMQTQGIDPD